MPLNIVVPPPETPSSMAVSILGNKKGGVFNTSVSAGTNIFSSDLTPSASVSIFRIYAAFDTAGVLSVVRSDGTSTVVENLNEGASLAANAAYIFDIIVESGYSINLRYSVDATCLYLIVIEIVSMV